MNNNLIITHKDGRTWNEGQLGELLGDMKFFAFQGHYLKNLRLDRVDGEWRVVFFYGDGPILQWHKPLDPSLYTVSPVGMIAVEKVREMVQEMEDSISEQLQPYNVCSPHINSIASKYLGEEI